jgi:hypothetical protein
MNEQITTTLHWTGDWPWYLGVGAGTALALVAFFLYRRDAMTGWRSFLLPLLRAVAIFMIVLMLSGPVLHHRKVIGHLARVLVCLDSSESMQLTDPAMDAGRKISIAQRLGLLDPSGPALDLPTAAERLGDARSLAAGLAAVDVAANPDAVERTRAAFAAKVAEADGYFVAAKANQESLKRFQAELAQPARELAAKELKAVDDRSRAAADLVRLGETAGRWSREVSELFQKKLTDDPEAAPLKAALAKFDALPRWQRLQTLLLEGRDNQRLLAELSKKHDVHLVLLENGVVKQFWQPGGENSALPTSLPPATGDSTNLTSALKFAVGDQNKSEKGAVILFSDGQHNAGDAPNDAAKILAERNMPVFTVGLGSNVPPRDLAILRTIVPDSVFYEDRVRGEVQLKEEVPPGQTFTLSIKDGDKVVWEKQLVTEGRAIRKVPFEFPVKELAEARLKDKSAQRGYEVLGAPLELKAIVTGLEGDRELSNNESPIRFRAITQKRRILMLDGRPRWESRYLRNLFERDEKWEVNAVIAGATNDAGFVRGDKPGTFPNDAKLLEAYDLIVFGEVPKTTLREEEMKWLADFVGKRGGAMVFIDGARGVLRQYGDTPLGPLLPVEWPAGATAIRGEIKSLSLAERATSLGAFALVSELANNGETWSKLQPPHWLSGGQPLPGAEVLLEAETRGGKMAASVLRPFGSGRVYYQAFDDSWRWRYEVGDLFHVKFWNQLASFVAEPPFAARDQFVQVDAGQLTYQPGEQADLRVRLRDHEGKPVTDTAVSAVLYRDGQKAAVLALTADEGGLYRGKTAALEPGNYEMAVESAAFREDQLKARTQFKVAPRENLERTLLSLNEPLLRQISVASGGEYFREEKVDELLTRLAPLSDGDVQEMDTPLWQSWWWFAPIVFLLTVEWILRKRAGLL